MTLTSTAQADANTDYPYATENISVNFNNIYTIKAYFNIKNYDIKWVNSVFVLFYSLFEK